MERPADKYILDTDNDGPISASEPTNAADSITVGYTSMPIESLPSRGRFYPEGTRLEFRPASVPEIKTYSGMDETDTLSITAAINHIIRSCIKLKFPDRVADGSYLKEFDKLYMLFAIRDLSIPEGMVENKLTTQAECPCGQVAKTEITHNHFGYYNISDKLLKWYDGKSRVMTITHGLLGEPVIMDIPSVGAIEAITKYVKDKIEKKRRGEAGAYYSTDAINYAQFMVSESKLRSNPDGAMSDFHKSMAKWSPTKLMVVAKAVELLSEGIRPTITHNCPAGSQCSAGGHFESPIRFRYKYLFDFQDIIGELF